MHVQPRFSLHHLERSETVLGGGGRSGRQVLLRAAHPHPGPLLVFHLWKHTCFALQLVQLLDKETDRL